MARRSNFTEPLKNYSDANKYLRDTFSFHIQDTITRNCKNPEQTVLEVAEEIHRVLESPLRNPALLDVEDKLWLVNLALVEIKRRIYCDGESTLDLSVREALRVYNMLSVEEKTFFKERYYISEEKIRSWQP